eukprot:scaffold803_cov310-Pinguiococcus_pyrenoidosus.AAC.218
MVWAVPLLQMEAKGSPSPAELRTCKKGSRQTGRRGLMVKKMRIGGFFPGHFEGLRNGCRQKTCEKQPRRTVVTWETVGVTVIIMQRAVKK